MSAVDEYFAAKAGREHRDEQAKSAAANMNAAQRERLTILEQGFGPAERLQWEPFDLPPGYVQAWFPGGFTAGIDPDGSAHS